MKEIEMYMIFGSTKILAKPINFNNFRLTPYGKLDLSHINFNEFSNQEVVSLLHLKIKL